MNNNPEIEQAVWRLLEGELEVSEFEALEAQLSSSEEARQTFLEIVDLEGLLEQKHSLTAAEPSVVPMDQVLQRQNQRYFKLSAYAAAAILLLLGVVMSVVWLKQSAPLLTFQHTDDAVFSVTHTAENTASDPDELAIGSRLLLTQGTVELTLKSGVQAIVRAPADLTLQEKNKLAQTEGIVHYTVPEAAIGFQVQSPDLLVTDLGTKFGVVSSPDELDQVHLFKGKVEVQCRKQLRKSEQLSGTESRIASNHGFLNSIASSPELFKTKLKEQLPYLHLSFDHINGDEFEFLGNLPGLDSRSAWHANKKQDVVLGEGKFGKTLQLDNGNGYIQTDWEGISGTKARSIAFWCKLPKATPKSKPHGLVSWGDQHTHGHKFVIVTNPKSDSGRFGAVRFDCGQGFATGETKLTDGQWHHVAVVMGGEVDASSGMHIQLYVDGKREELTGFRTNEPDTTPGTDEDSWLSVGRYRLPGMQNYNGFNGSLDELYIFSGVLTQSDIRQIMNGNWE